MPTLRKYPQDLRIFPDAKAESPTPAPTTAPPPPPFRPLSLLCPLHSPLPTASSPTRSSSAQPSSRPHPFVVSRAAVPGDPCRTTLTPTKPPKQSSLTTHYSQFTPPPSRHPGVRGRDPAATTPCAVPPAIPSDQPSLLRRPLLSEPRTTSAHGGPVKAAGHKANPRPMSTTRSGG